MECKESSSEEFQLTSKLNGHKSQVNSLAIRRNGAIVLCTGSDDLTVRLWDLDTNKPIKCYVGCFSSSIESVAFANTNPNILFVACENGIYSFDTTTEGIIQKHCSFELPLTDGVNFICVQQNDEFIAVGGDSGSITLIPITKNGCFAVSDKISSKRLSRGHENIVCALSFRNSKEIISGGFDCSLCFWDINRNRPISKVFFDVYGKEEGEINNQTFNPPFIHKIEFILNGRFVIVALGDGSVSILSLPDLKEFYRQEIHSGMINTMSLFDDDSILVTGGVDCYIRIWDIKIEETEKPKTQSKKKTSAPTPKVEKIELGLKQEIAHGNKINDILASKDLSFYSLYVSDTTNNISIYTTKYI